MSDRGGREDDFGWEPPPRRGKTDRERGYGRDEGLFDEPLARETDPASPRDPGPSERPSERGGVRRRSRRARSGSGTGLYGSEIGSNVLPAAVAELIGTFILVYTGTAVVVATVLDRPITGLAYDSLAIPAGLRPRGPGGRARARLGGAP